MKEYAKKPENQSRTLVSNPKAFRQASIEVILQRYREQNIQRNAEDEELTQGKFDTVQREKIDEDELLQEKFDSISITKQESAQGKEKPNNTGLPDNLKTGIENLSGYSMDDVKVHYNSDKPAQLQALAYAQSTDIHVAPGQEKHLPHEAWHVIQQKQGRVQPTMQMQGVNVNDNEELEREADEMGQNSLSFNKRRDKLYYNGVYGHTVQKQVSITITNGKNTENGESGNENETRDNITQASSNIRDTFDQEVKSKTVQKNDETGFYTRNWAMCAEPNAFSKLLKNHTTETLANLGNVHFKKRAYNDITKKYMDPCIVCQQWIDNDLFLKKIFNKNYYENRYKRGMNSLGLHPDVELPERDYIYISDQISSSKKNLIFIQKELKKYNKEFTIDNLISIKNQMPQDITEIKQSEWIKKNIIDKLDVLLGHKKWDLRIYYPLINQLTQMQILIDVEIFTPEILKKLEGKFEGFTRKIKNIKKYINVNLNGEKIILDDYLLWYNNIEQISIIEKAVKKNGGQKITYSQYRQQYTYTMAGVIIGETNKRRYEQIDKIRGL